tara:strand:- start:5300 stop:7435 length:2136 start_codon:yes stop_codon:yes gene_type:complete
MIEKEKIRMIRYAQLIVLMFSIIYSNDIVLDSPDGSTIFIHRDEYGVPHIVAENDYSVSYGQGFAEAQDRLFQMDLNRRGALGRLSEWFGSETINFDKDIRRLGYTKAEYNEMFSELDVDVQQLITAYVEGINAYADSMSANASKYKPSEYIVTEFEPWQVHHSLAFAVYFVRLFGMFGGEELSRLTELQDNGWEWFNQNRPINDSTCTTTLIDDGLAFNRNWSYSGMVIPDHIAEEVESHKQEIRQYAEENGLIFKLGSFSAAIGSSKSSTGNAMILGCPQMGGPNYNETSRTMEVELQSPDLHVGGLSIPGFPGVVIGHSNYMGWTNTSGVSDNVDVYIDSTQSQNFNDGYWHNGEWLDFEVITDTIYTYSGYEVFTHYRTIHGPVFSAYLPSHQVYSYKMTFWKKEIESTNYLYNAMKATNMDEFENAIKLAPMSFNYIVIDNNGNIGYWHGGLHQDRTDGVHPYLPHKGDGSEEWGGFIDFEDLPQGDNSTIGYFANYNNKPASWWNNGDLGPWINGISLCDRNDLITDYIASLNLMTLDDVKNIPYTINDHGTYQYALELSINEAIDYNINPPGQSAFINMMGVRSEHTYDQWPLHEQWEYKEQLFGETIVKIDQEIIPESFSISDPYPNPFNPITNLNIILNHNKKVTIEVIDVNGKTVETLINKKLLKGEHKLSWMPNTHSSGIYFIRIITSDLIKTKKILLLK